jgi:hypothetical protein
MEKEAESPNESTETYVANWQRAEPNHSDLSTPTRFSQTL